MFTDTNIRDLRVGADAVYVKALAEKLVDIDTNRIHSTDDLIIRKAVFGLLEIVAELEQRLIAIEGPQAREQWSARLAADLGARTPDELRLGE